MTHCTLFHIVISVVTCSFHKQQMTFSYTVRNLFQMRFFRTKNSFIYSNICRSIVCKSFAPKVVNSEEIGQQPLLPLLIISIYLSRTIDKSQKVFKVMRQVAPHQNAENEEMREEEKTRIPHTNAQTHSHIFYFLYEHSFLFTFEHTVRVVNCDIDIRAHTLVEAKFFNGTDGQTEPVK